MQTRVEPCASAFEASIRSTSMLSVKPMPSMVADRLLLVARPDPMPVVYL